jgi:hypothetical protein
MKQLHLEIAGVEADPLRGGPSKGLGEFNEKRH